VTTESIIAVAQNEVKQFGCPHCGFRSGSMPMSGGGSGIWNCGECGRECVVLAEGITKSSIGIGDEYPELQPHPRRGTPSHGTPDNQPDEGGEFFRSRGIGLDQTPGCFICGGDDGLNNNISAFVQCKAAGERVVAMFTHGARLDYRESEPDRVQVKIGACDTHKAHLEKLCELTAQDGTITEAKVTSSAA